MFGPVEAKGTASLRDGQGGPLRGNNGNENTSKSTSTFTQQELGNASAKVHTTSTVLMTRRRVIAASSLAAYLATILQSHMLTTKILMTCYAKVIRGISTGLIPVWLNWDLSAKTHCSYAQQRRCDDDVMLGCAYLSTAIFCEVGQVPSQLHTVLWYLSLELHIDVDNPKDRLN